MSRTKRRSAEEWTLLVQAQAQSDQTITQFCESHQINKHSFNYWRGKINRSGVSEQGFVSIQAKGRMAAGGLILHCGGGIELEPPADYSTELLIKLIRALQC